MVRRRYYNHQRDLLRIPSASRRTRGLGRSYDEFHIHSRGDSSRRNREDRVVIIQFEHTLKDGRVVNVEANYSEDEEEYGCIAIDIDVLKIHDANDTEVWISRLDWDDLDDEIQARGSIAWDEAEREQG